MLRVQDRCDAMTYAVGCRHSSRDRINTIQEIKIDACAERTGLSRHISRLSHLPNRGEGHSSTLDRFKTKISSSRPLFSFLPLYAIRPALNLHSLLSLSISSPVSIYLSFLCPLTPCPRSIRSLLVLAWSMPLFPISDQRYADCILSQAISLS